MKDSWYQTNITQDISEAERFETNSEAQDALLARNQRKALFGTLVGFSIFFLCLFAIEATVLFLGKPPEGPKEGYLHEIVLAMTGAVAMLLVTTAARLSNFKKTQNQSEDFRSSPNLLISLLAEILSELKSK